VAFPHRILFLLRQLWDKVLRWDTAVLQAPEVSADEVVSEDVEVSLREVDSVEEEGGEEEGESYSFLVPLAFLVLFFLSYH
jgi:hypothetical protein